MAEFGEQVDRVVAQADFGTPGAVKRGRNPKRPYVPIITWNFEGAPRTTQLKRLAYATRAEAVGGTQRQIEAERRGLAKRLLDKGQRVLREQYGLPRDLPAS